MNKYGLIGFPLTHSFSKKFFEEKFRKEGIEDHTYHLFPIPFVESFLSIIGSEPELRGLNVTIPYKQTVMEFLNKIDPDAAAIGAVNCIKIEGTHLTGYNTDAIAFEQSLKALLTSLPEQTFVMGTGGSAKAVCYILKKNGFKYLQVSRQKGDNTIDYGSILKNMKDSNLFVNTTPLGVFPDVKKYPEIPYSKLSQRDYLFDLIYNPEQTEFLRKGREKGARTKNGLEMLYLQAEKSWDIWNATS